MHYQKLKICSVGMNVQTTERGERWFSSYNRSFCTLYMYILSVNYYMIYLFCMTDCITLRRGTNLLFIFFICSINYVQNKTIKSLKEIYVIEADRKIWPWQFFLEGRHLPWVDNVDMANMIWQLAYMYNLWQNKFKLWLKLHLAYVLRWNRGKNIYFFLHI